MTKIEAAKKALEQGHCSLIGCDECPAYCSMDCKIKNNNNYIPAKTWGGLDARGIKFFKDYIKEHDMTDNDKALERLAAIEKEAAELRKIIEKPEMVYDETKLYVGVKDGAPYIMVGYDRSKYFRFHRFGGCSKTELGYDNPLKTGQKCLDYHIKKGLDIRVFDDTEGALEYFLSVLRSNK